MTQKLRASVPQDLTFRNEAGEPVQLSEDFDRERPVLLTLNYHRCPMLCKVQLRRFAPSLGEMDWVPGEKFRVLTVDITDPCILIREWISKDVPAQRNTRSTTSREMCLPSYARISKFLKSAVAFNCTRSPSMRRMYLANFLTDR